MASRVDVIQQNGGAVQIGVDQTTQDRDYLNMQSLLITGANRGIGLDLTRQYLEAGDRVIATCRNPDDAVELAQKKCDGFVQRDQFTRDDRRGSILELGG